MGQIKPLSQRLNQLKKVDVQNLQKQISLCPVDVEPMAIFLLSKPLQICSVLQLVHHALRQMLGLDAHWELDLLVKGGFTPAEALEVSMDLKQFFADKGYDEIVELALALSGQGGVSQVQLKATPEMGTPIGRIRYPGELTIVSTQFSN